LDKLDEAVESKQWLTRTQWIVEAIHDKLTKEGTQNGY
jgi:metal-responsive CopG/Arc/MetJ family transcriptional regulator